MIMCVSVNGLHHALAHTYDCTVVSIYDMTLTTHSVMCHLHIWNIILYLVLELPFTHFGNTHEHTMLRTFLFNLHQPHRPAQRPKTSLGVTGDEPCRLNGTVKASREPVDSTTCIEPSTGGPGGSHSPRPTRRPSPPTLAVGLTSSDVSSWGRHLGPGLVTPI